MSLSEIKDAVEAGKVVHWANTGYVVIKDRLGQFLVKFTSNDNCVGLDNRYGYKLNFKPEEFFLA